MLCCAQINVILDSSSDLCPYGWIRYFSEKNKSVSHQRYRYSRCSLLFVQYVPLIGDERRLICLDLISFSLCWSWISRSCVDQYILSQVLKLEKQHIKGLLFNKVNLCQYILHQVKGLLLFKKGSI